MDSKEDPNVLTSLWAKNSVVGTLPPLVPALPPDGLDWDTSFQVQGYHLRNVSEGERRHSGWGAVEKGWVVHDSAPPASRAEKA